MLDNKLRNNLSKILDMIFNNEIDKILKIKSRGDIGKLIKEHLLDTNILGSKNPCEFSLEALDFETQIIINTISDLVKRTSSSTCFESIISELLNVNQVKLWICISLVLNKNRDSILLLKNQEECLLNSQTILSAIENPEHFYLSYEYLEDDERSYINNLGKLFNYSPKNINYIDYKGIIDCIQEWVLSLPKYACVITEHYVGKGEYQKVDKKFIGFRNTIKIFPLQPVRTVRYKFMEIFDTKDFKALINEISKAKDYFDSLTLSTEEAILEDFNFIFDNDFKGWVERLTPLQRNYLYENSEEEIFQLINMEKSSLFKSLCKVCLGIQVDYFNDDSPRILFEKLKYIKNLIYENTNEYGTTKIIGPNLNFIFKKSEFNPKVEMLCNEISSILSEYGKSLSENEKRTALVYAIINKSGR